MKDIAALHRAEFDSPPDLIAAAPGVVKFLGEHTEASDGLVLAASLSFELRVAVSLRRDSSLRFFAADLGERKRTSLSNLKFKREDRWANYPKAVIHQLIASGSISKGANFTIAGDIPMGLGLASSSALGLASAMAMKELLGLPQKGEDLAEFARSAEADFFGHSVPIFDNLAAIAPGAGTASIVDLRTGRRRAVPFLEDGYVIVLTDSKVPRLNVDAELRQRDEDCRTCLEYLARGSAKTLRDFGAEEVDELMGVLPESVRRRCLHVVEEAARVIEAEDALVRGDAAAFGRAVVKSHASLRNLFEVSCPEIDWLAKRALEIDGVLCSRLTGKGFGGCTVSVMTDEALPEYRKRLEDYER
ncbi:MAG TPA: galactokinase family protein, partial [Rectinemataceae bacterium]|nr:galactokinase family protein [Rectinemataceae bacterium]